MLTQQRSIDRESIGLDKLRAIRVGALNEQRIVGHTHCFYRYPARFSPAFAGAVIESCSKPGDIVLDPFMGGGTTIVEALARGRIGVGCDLNSLAVFVSNAKTTFLKRLEREAITVWALERVPSLMYRVPIQDEQVFCESRTRNLSLPRARPTKKLIAQALLSLDTLPSRNAQQFARCVLLNVSQWALHNRRRTPTIAEFRARLEVTVEEMLHGLMELQEASARNTFSVLPTLYHGSAKQLDAQQIFRKGEKAKLVVTSPPYPGIHMLYHRWQVDGRKETPAPYWIADCLDGNGTYFYNFGSRNQNTNSEYFDNALANIQTVRRCVADDALVVQLIAFSDPPKQLPRYLRVMEEAGFTEVNRASQGLKLQRFRRFSREVPSRSWHATLKGRTTSSREVVLIHRAE